MAIFYLPLVVIVLCYALYSYFTRTFNYWKKRNVAGPTPTAFFGNLKESTLRRKNIGVLIQDIYNMFPEEKIVGMYRMTTPCLLIRDLDIIKSIMIKDFNVFDDRGIEYSKRGLGENLFHADSETWRVLRSQLSPTFTSGKLKNMYHLMNDRANLFMDYLSSECKNSPEFDIYSLIQKYTISTIAICAFGVNIDTINDKTDAWEHFNKLVITRNYRTEVDMMIPGLLEKINLSLIPSHIQNYFKGLVKNIIIQRDGKPADHHDFMDILMKLRDIGKMYNSKYENSQQPVLITDDLIAAQAFVFYVAGYVTSAMTMSYLLYQLALNPDIQDKVIAEIYEITEAHDGKVTYESLQQMKYLHKAFDETLRMYSLIEPLQRKAKVDYKIPGTDVIVKRDQIVLISPRGIHYDPKYYSNPEVFDPNRFDIEVASTRHPCAYLPFGTGPKNCIGMRFSMLQSELCVVKILSKFRVEPSQNTNLNIEVDPFKVIIGPKGGIYLNIVPRI